MSQSRELLVNKQPDKARGGIILNNILILIMATITITPYLSRNVSYIFNLFIWASWVISSLALPKRISIKESSVIMWWLLYMCWILLMCLIGHSNISVNFILIRLPIYTVPIMLPIIISQYNMREKTMLWKGLLIIVIINLTHNVFLGIINPDAFDHLDGLDASKSDNATNAGGTTFVVLCLFIAAISYIILRCGKNKKGLFLTILITALFYILVLNTRATVFVVLILIMFGFYLASKTNANGKRLLISAAIIITVFSFFSVSILEWLGSEFSESQRMSDRLGDLLSLAEGTDIEDLEEGSLASRYLLWMTSINTFLSSASSFIIGIGEDSHDFDMFSLIKCGVGYHSEFFDLLAKYGIIGAFIVFWALRSVYKQILSLVNNLRLRRMTIVVLAAFTLYSFVNTTFIASEFYILFVFFPLTLLLIEENKI